MLGVKQENGQLVLSLSLEDSGVTDLAAVVANWAESRGYDFAADQLDLMFMLQEEPDEEENASEE